MKKKIMILGASILQVPVIKKAKELGLIVIVVDCNPKAVGFNEDDIIKEIISTNDISAVLKCARKYNIDGIITTCDMPVRTVAAVVKELNLIGITQETALIATNKGVMRNELYKKNIPIPLFIEVNTKEEFIDAVYIMKKKGIQCIIKPVDNSGSRGVSLILDEDKEKNLTAYKYAKKYSKSGNLIVEEYMKGPEVSVETISIDGVCHVIQITDKLITKEPYFVEMGHSQPSKLSDEVKKNIVTITKQAVEAIGIRNGPAHTEVKITCEGAKIVEIGARLGGDCIATHLVPLSTGVDMVKSCIDIAMGNKPDIVVKHNTASAIRYFDVLPGKIKSVSGLEKARRISGIKQISILNDIGDDSVKVKNSNDRVGFVIAEGSDVTEALNRIKEAVDMIDFNII